MDSFGTTAGSPDPPPKTIVEVLGQMAAIEAALPPADGVACFDRLYRTVTAAVAGALDGAAFRDPGFLTRLDVVFAGLYFAALDAFPGDPDHVPRAWYPLFADRARTDIAPIQFALAGMNAHINRDLMVALVRTFEEKAIAPARDTPQYADYLAVNALLERTEAAYKNELLSGLLIKLDHLFSGVDDVIANWSIVEARNAAWAHAETLWVLRDSPALTSAYIDTIDGLAGFAGRGLLLPTKA
jgi:hypothetical protein